MQIGFLVQQKGFRNIGGHMKAGRKETIVCTFDNLRPVVQVVHGYSKGADW